MLRAMSPQGGLVFDLRPDMRSQIFEVDGPTTLWVSPTETPGLRYAFTVRSADGSVKYLLVKLNPITISAHDPISCLVNGSF